MAVPSRTCAQNPNSHLKKKNRTVSHLHIYTNIVRTQPGSLMCPAEEMIMCYSPKGGEMGAGAHGTPWAYVAASPAGLTASMKWCI